MKIFSCNMNNDGNYGMHGFHGLHRIHGFHEIHGIHGFRKLFVGENIPPDPNTWIQGHQILNKPESRFEWKKHQQHACFWAFPNYQMHFFLKSKVVAWVILWQIFLINSWWLGHLKWSENYFENPFIFFEFRTEKKQFSWSKKIAMKTFVTDNHSFNNPAFWKLDDG